MERVSESTRTGWRTALETASRWERAPGPEDAQLIQNLVQAYALFADAGRPEDLAALFTADAEWDGDELGYGRAQGPEAIGAAVAGHFRPDRPMMHTPGPALLTVVDETEVRGVCWCLATRWDAGEARPLIHFYYEDVVRKADDGRWRFRRRYLRPASPSRPA